MAAGKVYELSTASVEAVVYDWGRASGSMIGLLAFFLARLWSALLLTLVLCCEHGPRSHQKIEHYRQQAAQLREIAQKQREGPNRDRLSNLATHYDRLAERAASSDRDQ